MKITFDTQKWGYTYTFFGSCFAVLICVLISLEALKYCHVVLGSLIALRYFAGSAAEAWENGKVIKK